MLITGGWNGASSLDSAYVYDAATNTCSSVGPMAAPRSQHTATLVNGVSQEVFIAGGWSVGAPTATTELYTDLVVAGTPRFSAGPTLAAARNTHTATFVRDCPAFISCSTGDVYLAGGYGAGSTLSSIEFYDRSTSTIAGSGNMDTSRGGHTATLLNGGDLMFTGGWETNVDLPGGGEVVSSVEIHDGEDIGSPASITTTSLSTARNWHTATRLSNGDVIIAGGKSGFGSWNTTDGFLSSAELYTPGTGFSTVSGFKYRAQHG